MERERHVNGKAKGTRNEHRSIRLLEAAGYKSGVLIRQILLLPKPVRRLLRADLLVPHLLDQANPDACRCPAPLFSWPRPSTTAHGDGADDTFEVIHPHHPLRGQEFKLVTYRHNWGEDRVYFHDSSGLLRSIPACWTTVLPADPFVVLAAGRCLFRYEDLLKLADLMEKAR
jgi:hypothetical protein